MMEYKERLTEAAEEFMQTAIDSGENCCVDDGSNPLFSEDYLSYSFMEGANWHRNNVWHSCKDEKPQLCSVVLCIGHDGADIKYYMDESWMDRDMKRYCKWCYFRDIEPDEIDNADEESKQTKITPDIDLDESPFRAGKQAHWSAPMCKITEYAKFYIHNTPLRPGSWYPNDYATPSQFNDFVKWLEANHPECLDPNDDENILYVSMGTSFENPKLAEHSVDIDAVVYNWIEKFVGGPVGGQSVKAPCFGPIGAGSKYFANHYYKNGGIIIKGNGDVPGDHEMSWLMMFPKSVWTAMRIFPLDEYYGEESQYGQDPYDYIKSPEFKENCQKALNQMYEQR